MTSASIKTQSLASETLEERIVAYVDLLGFRNLINRVTPGNEKEIKQFFFYFKTFFKSDGELSQTDPGSVGYRSTFSFFSDSIIVSIPAVMDERIREMLALEKTAPHFNVISPNFGFTNLIHTVNRIQSYCLLNMGLLTRGAISAGLTYHNDKENAVFGCALNQSVFLEENIAITPRIIIDRKFVEKCHQDHRNAYLKQDTDGYWFVNFMRHCFSIPDIPLEQMKATIERGLRSENERHQQKWQWLALQFNEESKEQRRVERRIKEISM